MSITAFILLSIILLVGALMAFALRDTIHCALGGALAFVALGVFYIALGAEFIGLVQLLVYVGAVAILIVFVILLTRPQPAMALRLIGSGMGGGITALAVLIALLLAIFRSPSLDKTVAAPVPEGMIKTIGENLVGTHLLPLQAVAVLLTAALIGAALFAWDEEPDNSSSQ